MRNDRAVWRWLSVLLFVLLFVSLFEGPSIAKWIFNEPPMDSGMVTLTQKDWLFTIGSFFVVLITLAYVLIKKYLRLEK